MSSALRLKTKLAPVRLAIARFASRHYASSTEAASAAVSESAATAKTAAQNVAGKASQGLSRVSSSAGPALKAVGSGVGNALNRVGGRTGRSIKWIEGKVPTVVYYSRVGLELGRIIVQGQKMSPPSISTFQSYFQRILHHARNPTSLTSSVDASTLAPNKLMSQARSISGQQLAVAGVVVAELIGFFTIGEMVGRLKLVGYRGETRHH